jgi:hypothetical protein
VAPLAVSLMVMDCADVYVPAGTLKAGGAVGGRLMVNAALAIALG